MAKYTNEEIYNAVKVIADTCEEYKNMFKDGQCVNCPLRNVYDDCGVIDREPCDWVTNELDEWTAFRF